MSDAPVAKFFKGKGRKGKRNFRKRARSSDDEDDGVVVSARKVAPSKNLHTFGSRASAAKKDAAAEVLKGLQHKSSGTAAPTQYASAVAETRVDGALPAGAKRGNKFTGTGPIRAPTNVRNTSVFDYAPDICKDYKETGFCGYGDSCKFMHDRGDYKAGWQIEKEWEEQQRKAREALANGGAASGSDDDDDNKYVIDSDEEDLPFACFLCREDFKNPIATQCGHYFCRQCALDRYSKNTTCAACGKQTFGVFNVAKKLMEALKSREALAESVGEGEGDDGADRGSDDGPPSPVAAPPKSSGGGFVDVE